MRCRALVAVSFALLMLPRVASAQLEQSFRAHGGLEKWKSYTAVEYDLAWKGANFALRDHQLFNLQTRDGLITSDKYKIGARAGEVWISPNQEALMMPARFYAWTPFYFFAMPFVFADPGAIATSIGRKNWKGQEYEAVKITYQKGTGDSPDDFYIAYLEPTLGLLKLACYIVTYPTMMRGKSLTELKTHAIIFEEWQDVDGLRVPKRGVLYDWVNDDTQGDARGQVVFSNVKFSAEAPLAARFEKPQDAVVAPLQ